MKIIQSLNEVKFFKDHMRRGCFGFWLVMTPHSPLNCFIQEGQVFWYTPIFSAKSWKYSLCIILHCMMCIISHRQKETKSPHFTPGGCIRNFRSSNGEILFRLKKKKKIKLYVCLPFTQAPAGVWRPACLTPRTAAVRWQPQLWTLNPIPAHRANRKQINICHLPSKGKGSPLDGQVLSA